MYNLFLHLVRAQRSDQQRETAADDQGHFFQAEKLGAKVNEGECLQGFMHGILLR